MADSDVKFGISAEDAGFEAAMIRAQELAAESAESIKASFESLTGTFTQLNGAFAILTAALAGGEAFKETVKATVDLTLASVGLGKQLGISATEASQLKVALNSVFISQDTLSAANSRIAQTLNKNEQAFKDLGVATRDSNGNFRSSLEVLEGVITKLNGFAAGNDRNVEGIKIFGRSWNDLQGILRLTPQVIDAAKDKADELGLTIGQENVDAAKKYRSGMLEVHEAIEAVGKVVGDAVLPALGEAAEYFGSKGPQAVAVMRVAVQTLGAVFESLTETVRTVVGTFTDTLGLLASSILAVFGQDSAPITGMEFFQNVLKVIGVGFQAAAIVVKIACEVIAEAIGVAVDGIKRLGMTSTAFVNAVSGQGSWSQVATAWDQGTRQMEAAAIAHEARMKDILLKGKEETDKLLMADFTQAPTVTPTAPSPGGNRSTGGEDTDKNGSIMANIQAELAMRKQGWAEQEAAAGTFRAFTKTQELAFWVEMEDVVVAGSNDELKVRQEVAKEIVGLDKQAYDEQLSNLKLQESGYKNNLQAKLILAEEYAEKIRIASEGGDQTQANAAAAHALDIARQLEAQRLQVAEIGMRQREAVELGGMDAAETAAQGRVQLGIETNAELIAQEQALESARYQVKLQELEREKALLSQAGGDNDPVKIAQNNAAIEALATAHNAKMQQLSLKSTLEQSKDWKSLTNSITAGFTTAFANFLKGSATIGQTVRSMFATVANAIAEALAQMAAKAITAMVEQMIFGKTGASASIEDNAAAAGAGAFAATAAIPYIGPELAPEAGQLAYAGALSYEGALSAAGGFDIPAGVNPMVQTHEKEMILPAKHADVIRDMADGSGGSAGGGTHHYNIHAVDAPSFHKMLQKNKASVATAVHSHLRSTGRVAPAH